MPPGSAFTRTLNGTGSQAASSVSVSGRTVTATFATAARHGQSVRFWYQRPSDNTKRLKDLSGNLASGLGNRRATNVTPPAFSSASVNEAALTVTFDGGLDTASVPAAGAFTVKVGGTAVDLADTSPVAVSGSTATLTLAKAVLRVNTVTVSYAAPATGNKLQDADNGKNAVPDFADKAVTNNTPADTTGPGFVSATMNGKKLVITFDEALNETAALRADQFQRTTPGSGNSNVQAQSVSVSGRTVTATYSRGVSEHGQPVTVSYDKASDATKRLKDLSGNEAPEFSGQTVTNATPPAFSSASVNGAALTVTFNGGLDTASVPAAGAFTVKVGGTAVDLAETSPVAVSGSTVTLTLAKAVLAGDTLTVSYAAPATGDKLQDADNGKNPVPDFTDKAVTNANVKDGTAPTVSSATIDAATLTLNFNEALHAGSVPAASAFAVKVGGGSAETLAATNPVAVAGSAVTLKLALPVAAHHAVTVGYTKPATGAKLRDRSGEEAATFADRAVTNNTGAAAAPRVTMVEIASKPSIDADSSGSAETYGRGAQIRVKVTWSADVTWDASAQGAALSVGLEIGDNTRTAALETGGLATGTARSLFFQYTVQAGDRDSDGIVVGRTAANDVVALAGGATLKDAQARDASRQRAAPPPATRWTGARRATGRRCSTARTARSRPRPWCRSRSTWARTTSATPTATS